MIIHSLVERVILDLPEVAAVCVFGVPDKKYGETIKAGIGLNPGDELGPDSVQQAVAERIASFIKPRLVEWVEGLPRTDYGEVNRE